MREEEETVQALIHPAHGLSRIIVSVVAGNARGVTTELLPGVPICIGKSSDNQLVLDDRSVSRYHVELTLGQGAIEVRDLESTNGTYVGVVRVEHVRVSPGTRLTIGSNTIALDAVSDEAPSARPESAEATELPGVVAQSPAMREVARYVGRLARTNVTVLLHGETGAGKEVLARALHDLSERRNHPFEVVDCGSMAPTLIASELFGHERGAFTGAQNDHAGAFERAHGGTVFLDEIGELPIELQPMLLGVLARRRFKRVGGTRERTVDVRVIAATHRDLRAAANTGVFRADLYFRLAVARVVVPPLRERRQDIEPLVRRFAEELMGEANVQPFDGPTLAALEAHPWAGNVRELRNVVESAIALGSVVLEGHVTSEERVSGVFDAVRDSLPLPDLAALPYRVARARAVAAFERTYLRQLNDGCGGNASEAARRAKMDRPYLLGLFRKHGLR